MYKPFFSENIFAYIEFIILLGFFMFLIYKNFHKLSIIYINKLPTIAKFLILIITILLNSIIFLTLAVHNINWTISIAINAFMVSLILFLSFSAFWNKTK